MALLAELSAGESLHRVPAGFADLFDGSMDLSSDFVDAIVDTDFIDRASFSGRVFMLGRGAELIAIDAMCLVLMFRSCCVFRALDERDEGAVFEEVDRSLRYW
jgi:hypothetical protein